MRRICSVIMGLMLWSAVAPSPGGAQEGNGRIPERVLEYKRRQLGPALKIDQGQVDRLLEVERRHQPQQRQLRQDLRREMARLRQLLQQPAPSDAEAKAILDNLKGKRQEMLTLRQKMMDEGAALLTPVQQARYVLFMGNMKRQMLQEARGVRGGRGDRRLRPPPASEDSQALPLPDFPLE